MGYGLNLDILPEFTLSAYKLFSTNERYITRVFDMDVLIMMLDGTLYFNEDGIPITLKKNDYYIQRRGLRQQGILPSSGAKYYYVHFRGQYEECRNCLPIRGFVDARSMRADFDKLDVLSLSGVSQVEKSALFYKILSALKRDVPASEQERLFQKITAEIAEHMDTRYTLDTISHSFGYSKNQIIKVFKEQAGVTPYTYIINMKMARAKEYLANSNAPVSQIAIQTGFKTYVNFYKSFVSLENCTPQEYRKMAQKEKK